MKNIVHKIVAAVALLAVVLPSIKDALPDAAPRWLVAIVGGLTLLVLSAQKAIPYFEKLFGGEESPPVDPSQN
jgi:hypothetical protein